MNLVKGNGSFLLIRALHKQFKELLALQGSTSQIHLNCEILEVPRFRVSIYGTQSNVTTRKFDHEPEMDPSPEINQSTLMTAEALYITNRA